MPDVLPTTLPLPAPGLERVRHLMQALVTAARAAAVPLDPATAQDTIEALDTIAVDNAGWLRELNAAVDRDEQRARDDEADAEEREYWRGYTLLKIIRISERSAGA